MTADLAWNPDKQQRGRAGAAAIMVAISVMVGLFSTARAAAGDVLVENFNETTLPLVVNLTGNTEAAQRFTTGANVTGYRLESISLITSPGRVIKTTTGEREPLYVHLREDNGSGEPGDQVASLTKDGGNYAGPTDGTNKYRVWKARCYPQPPGGGCVSDASSVHLEPGTQYWVHIWAGNHETTIRTELVTTGQTGATGWLIGDKVLVTRPGSGWTAESLPIRIKAEGKTNPAVNVSISDVTVTEGVELTADFVVSLDRATSGVVSMGYFAVDVTAEEDGDYERTDSELDGRLVFQPGETVKTVSVPILDDARAESNETFLVVFDSLKGATWASPNSDGNGQATGTIQNAEPLTISVSNATAHEGTDETIDFTVSLNRATNREVEFELLFSSDTAHFAPRQNTWRCCATTSAPTATATRSWYSFTHTGR